MAKNVEQICKALKLSSAKSTTKALTFRVGQKKYQLPFESRLLNRDNYMFIHVLPSAGIFRIENGQAVLVTSAEEAASAAKILRSNPKKKSSRKSSGKSAELPADLQDALRKIPSGYKLVTDARGGHRLAKMRPRSK